MKSLEQEIADEKAAWGAPPELPPGGLAEAAQQAGAEVQVAQWTTDPEPSTEPVELGARETAFIRISPDTDPAYFALKAELVIIQRYAEKAVITTQDDAKLVTNDLVLMAKLGKSIEACRQTYVKPVWDYLDAFNASFKELSEPLKLAEAMTKNKILAFNRERQEAYRLAEAARVQAEAEAELARLEALQTTGEIIDTPIITTARTQEPQKAIRAEMGTAGQVDCWKWKTQDLTKIPAKYYTLNEAMITKLVKAGERDIPGIEIYNEPYIQTRT